MKCIIIFIICARLYKYNIYIYITYYNTDSIKPSRPTVSVVEISPPLLPLPPSLIFEMGICPRTERGSKYQLVTVKLIFDNIQTDTRIYMYI